MDPESLDPTLERFERYDPVPRSLNQCEMSEIFLDLFFLQNADIPFLNTQNFVFAFIYFEK